LIIGSRMRLTMKAGKSSAATGCLPSARPARLDRLVSFLGGDAADQLDQLHHRHRVHEVHADEAARAVGRGASRVIEIDEVLEATMRVRAEVRHERLEDLLLDLLVLGRRLDDESQSRRPPCRARSRCGPWRRPAPPRLILPRATCRWLPRSMLPTARCSASSLMSSRRTG
jgi:hypothetical protein